MDTNRRKRLQHIIEIVTNDSISNQNQLAEKLAKRGINVTQATLSRDIKTLRITKIPISQGEYMYIIPDNNHLHDTLLKKGRTTGNSQQNMVLSIDFSGNIMVLKTRNGYAPGLAYDIDVSDRDVFMGSIAGANTVFVVLREGVTHEQAAREVEHFINPPTNLPLY
jgi:transcriptional regulator of arginine metabolism